MSDGKQAPQNIQDAFLNTVRREKTTVTIYLLNGAKLLGRIRSFDKFSVLLESGAHEQLIFKHAISGSTKQHRRTAKLLADGRSDARILLRICSFVRIVIGHLESLREITAL